jgi:hypothetical protein
MLHAALLAVAVATAPSTASGPAKTSIQQCFEAMDGAVYHGDPSDRPLMKANVAACENGIKQIGRMRPTAAQGPEKLFLTGRILDRAATLSFIGSTMRRPRCAKSRPPISISESPPGCPTSPRTIMKPRSRTSGSRQSSSGRYAPTSPPRPCRRRTPRRSHYAAATTGSRLARSRLTPRIRRSRMQSPQAIAAVGDDHRSGHEARCRRGEVDDGRSKFVGCSGTLHGRVLDPIPMKLRIVDG